MNKKLQLLLIFLSLGINTTSFSQTPQSNFINYQGLANDASGEPIINQSITVGIALKFGDPNAAISYEENHDITTDAKGIFSLAIGNGNTVSGDYNVLPWNISNAVFVTVSIDGSEIGTTELLAVPYAIIAGNGGGAKSINELEDGRSNSSGSSIFLGLDAGTSDDGTNSNVGIGFHALRNNTTGNFNTATGFNALENNTNGINNTAYGTAALFANITGSDNTATGTSALLSNTIGSHNTATGSNALLQNTTGVDNTANGFSTLLVNTTGNFNTAIGVQALFNNTGGNNNTSVGRFALRNNTIGSNNTANGVSALELNNTGSNNTANGSSALRKNTTGSQNTANGNNALENNTTGQLNVASGAAALRNSRTGSNNTANGVSALLNNTTGDSNTAIGRSALRNNTTGSSNTAVGNTALSNLTSGNNNTALGNNAQVPNTTGSNQIRIGNAAVTYAGVQVAWTITSDAAWKDDIQQLPYGLNMITQLKPVDYIRKNNKNKAREIGFIAQDVELLLKKMGYTNSGMLTTDDDAHLSLRYNDFIPLLTKAVQELHDKTTVLEKMNRQLIKRIEKLENQ